MPLLVGQTAADVLCQRHIMNNRPQTAATCGQTQITNIPFMARRREHRQLRPVKGLNLGEVGQEGVRKNALDLTGISHLQEQVNIQMMDG